MEIIRTNHLVLRDLEESDWREVHRYASDDNVVRYMNFGPNTEQETRMFIRRALETRDDQPRTNYDLAVVLGDAKILIGDCGIYVTDSVNREGRIGYCLSREFWGRGYATETAGALIRFGFEKLSLHRIYTYCYAENTASANVLEKIGMEREGRLRQSKLKNGRWHDELLYAVLEP